MALKHDLGFYSCEKIKNTFKEIEVHIKIEDFFSLSLDEYYTSTDFYFRSTTRCWVNINFDNDHVTLCLKLHEVRVPYDVMCTFGIKKSRGSVVDIFTCNHTLDDYEVSIVVHEFLNRNLLWERKSELLVRGSLIITCKIRHLDMKLEGLEKLSKNIMGLFTNGEFCDTTLHVQDKEFKAHKIILAARSSVFAAMLTQDMSEKQTGTIDIPDCDPYTFEQFLEYLYSGKVENISLRDAIRLYRIADKYNVEELKMFCFEYFEDNLNVENFCDLFVIIDECGEKDFLSLAQIFFNRNIRRITLTAGWKSLCENNFNLTNKFSI